MTKSVFMCHCERFGESRGNLNRHFRTFSTGPFAGITVRDTRCELLVLHQLYEIFEQIVRVVWAGGGFGVVLDGEGRLVFAAESLVRVVVEVQVRQLDIFIFERVGVHAEAVVLAGDFDFSGLEILNGVVGSAVAKLELVGFGAERQGENLVAETDAEDGDFAEKFADGLDCVVNGRRVAGAVA